MLKIALRSLFLALACCAVGAAAGFGQTPGSGVDQAVTDTARVLAGLAPGPGSRLAAVSARPEWQAWQREFDHQWTQATTDRFARIAVWRTHELAPATGACGTLMYPFAGPDILNALLFFPDCKRYVMFGLEQPGTLPPIDQLPPERLARLLDETRRALNDLLERNYFITSHMMQDTAALELRGVLPLMAVILVRMEARIVSVRELEIDDAGQLVPRQPSARERRPINALEVVFARPDREPQVVVYFRAQAEDAAIGKRAGVLAFLKQDAPYPTFLKSASYLMHGGDFSIVRQIILTHSRLVLEDDSGIPLRFFKAPEWTLTYYGKYDKPVKDFNYGFQEDMAKIFADEKAVKPLPFSFGYHWKDGASSVLLAVKPSPVPAQK
jgi:hypothetical protein